MTAPAALSPVSVQKIVTAAALVAVAAVCWVFLLASEEAMRSMQGDGFIMDMMWAMMKPSAAGDYFLAAALMWIIMMVAMMIPAVLPVAMVYRGMQRGAGTVATWLFASGYLASWSLFSLVAAGLQWGLHNGGFLHGHMLETRGVVTAGILIGAGIYQLTPLKDACLAKCRSPIGFLMANWRDGRLGAFRMGFAHGFFCIGCCWVLMLLMFAGGAMSVAVMAALSVFILAERLLPPGPWVAHAPGFLMIVLGVWLLVGS